MENTAKLYKETLNLKRKNKQLKDSLDKVCHKLSMDKKIGKFIFL